MLYRFEAQITSESDDRKFSGEWFQQSESNAQHIYISTAVDGRDFLLASRTTNLHECGNWRLDHYSIRSRVNFHRGGLRTAIISMCSIGVHPVAKQQTERRYGRAY